MAVLKTYPLDLTGTLASNKITGEVKTIAKDADRVFIPTGGPFHTKSLKIWSGTTLLQPVKDYVALELNREGTLAAGKEICNVLFIKNTAVSFKLDYQVIGGIYSDYSNELADLINSTPIDKLNVLTWGSILGKPTTFPPSAHVHYPYEWRGYTQVVHLLEMLRQLIVAGDQAQIASIYQYIENNIKDIAADYINKNGLFFIDKTPTPNGNILLDGLGTPTAPLKLNLEELLDELDIRYFQNSINPLSRVGAISDSFLPISSGFFNCLVPLNRNVSLSAVANVERNGDLLTLTPATNGEITRYVYGYVRGWSNDPTVARFRPTNQQYRPPGLAVNEEIMDLFGYHEQSMIGSIFTVASDGSSTFKEHCVIWLNGTLAAESHVLERIGRELMNVLPSNSIPWAYSHSPKVVKMRRGEIFLLYYNDNSGIHVYRWDVTAKRYVQTTNWKAVVQKNIVEPNADQKVHKVTSSVETVYRTGQDYCRPFAWYEFEKKDANEYTIFDTIIKDPDLITSWNYNQPGNNRKRMGVRVVGDVIKVMANITWQAWIYDPAYRGGSRECMGFTLEIYPLEQIPMYKWIRHSRENGIYSTGRNSSYLTAEDRGHVDIYATGSWSLIPMDLFSYWEWWENLQPRTHLQLNDGRLLTWAHPTPSGYPVVMQSPRYTPEGEYDVEKLFVLYHNTRQWRHPSLANGGITRIGEDVINFPAPTVNRVNSSAVVLGDGTLILGDRRTEPRSIWYGGVTYTAYRPSASVIDYPTATNGVVQGFDTSADRIKLVGDASGVYDLIPWVSARRANGTVKVGALWWYKPIGNWADQSAPANIRIDWAAKQFIREEMYTFTEQGYNAVQDFLTTFVAQAGATTTSLTWSIIASPIDPNSGLLISYAGRDNRTANEYVNPVKLLWDGNRRLTGITIDPTPILTNTWSLIPFSVADPRYGWSRLQWVIDYSSDMTKAFWAGKMPGVSNHSGDTMSRVAISTYLETKVGATSTWAHLASEGKQDNTSGYKTLAATARGVGMMTDEVGYGVFRALRPMKSLNYDTGSIYKVENPFIYLTPRPPSDFSLSITDIIDVQLGGVYGQILPQTYSLSDPAVSDIIDPRNKTIFIYAVLELGKPRINFREVAMAESIYATYLGKCTTDEYGVMELDIQPVTRIGNYRPSATPRGASFSVSSGTADVERLLNWDANVFSSDDAGSSTLVDVASGNTSGQTYTQTIQPGERYKVLLLGPGGGAGGVRAANFNNASDGGSATATTAKVSGQVFFGAGGGEGGTQSRISETENWDGVRGKGGTVTIGNSPFAVSSINVNQPYYNPSEPVGNAGTPGVVIPGARYGYGGKGTSKTWMGSGSHTSGAGGGGAAVEFVLANLTGQAYTLEIAIGVTGAGGVDSTTSERTEGGESGYFKISRYV